MALIKRVHGYVIEGTMYNINDIKSIFHENIFTFNMLC